VSNATPLGLRQIVALERDCVAMFRIGLFVIASLIAATSVNADAITTKAQSDPPPMKWSARIFMKRRIRYGNQTT